MTARKAYQRRSSIDPSYLPASLSLARLYVTMNQYDRAIGVYQNALKSHPREAAVYHELGLCQARQKQWEPALGNLNRARNSTPKTISTSIASPSPWLAPETMSRASCLSKTMGECKAHYELARMLHHLGQDDQCRQHLQLALQLDPSLTPAQQLLVGAEQHGRSASASGSANYLTPGQMR